MDLNTPLGDWLRLSSRGTAFDLILLPIHIAQIHCGISVDDYLKPVSGYGGNVTYRAVTYIQKQLFQLQLLSSFCQFLLHINIKIQGHSQLWKEADKFILIPPASYNMCSQEKDGRLLIFLKKLLVCTTIKIIGLAKSKAFF